MVIYKIVNKINGHYYLGSSTQFRKRILAHKSSLRQNKHHSIILQNAWNKYGEDNFEFIVVEECKNEIELRKIEQKYLNLEDPSMVYNISGCASGGDLIKNHPNREEIIKYRGRRQSEEWNKRTPEEKKCPHLSGNKNPNWKNNKMKMKTTCRCGNPKGYSATKCMKCHDKKGNKNPFYGKKHSQETLEKIKATKLLKPQKLPINTIKVEINGIVYDSATKASLDLDCNHVTVLNRCRSEKFPHYKLVEE